MRLAQKQCLRNFVTFFLRFYDLICHFFGHKTFKTTCLWSLVVVLEWVSILQEWGKWSGPKKLVSIGRNMSKKGVGSKCALCLHHVVCYQETDLKFFSLVWSSFEAPNSNPWWSKTLLGSFQDLIWAEIAQNQIDKVILIFSGFTWKTVCFSQNRTPYTSISA